jgi:hypothetical protein
MKTIRNITCIIALATLVAGCITAPQITTPFDESAFQPFVGKGTSTISGQAFQKTVSGEVRYGAGDTVSLIPVTPYTTEMTSAWLHNFNQLRPHADPRLQQYIREVIADGNGNFEFQNIPVGDYYIVCPIFWRAGNQYGGIEPTGGTSGATQASAALAAFGGNQDGVLQQTGAIAFAKTHIGDGETIKVVVTSQ